MLQKRRLPIRDAIAELQLSVVKGEKCLGISVNACDSRFRPVNKVCGEKMFLEAGCSDKGELNPAKLSGFSTNETPQSYKSSI